MQFNLHHYYHLDPATENALRQMNGKLDVLIQQGKIEMSQADDLNNAVTSLTTAFTALDAAVQVQLGTINNDPGLSDAAKAAVANIALITSKMATDSAALTASIPAATTVPPPTTTPVDTGAATVTPPVIATPPITAPNATPPSTPPDSATSA